MKKQSKADLNAYDFKDSVAQLIELDETIGLIPEHARKSILKELRALQTAVEDHGLSSNREVVNRASTLIGSRIGGLSASKVTKFMSLKDAHRAHRARNLLLACVLVGSRGDFDKRTAEGVSQELPALKPRTSAHRRPYVDDEIVLMRVWAFLLAEIGGKHGRRSAAVYAQCDSGMVPGETTMMRPCDVVLGAEASYLWAPGLKLGVRERLLPLDPFQRHLIENFVPDLKDVDPDSHFTYNARVSNYDYKSAMVSAAGIVDRQRAAVGLNHEDTTASSITTWRTAYTREHCGGAQAALAVSGRTSEENLGAMLRNMVNPKDARAVRKKKRETSGF